MEFYKIFVPLLWLEYTVLCALFPSYCDLLADKEGDEVKVYGVITVFIVVVLNLCTPWFVMGYWKDDHTTWRERVRVWGMTIAFIVTCCVSASMAPLSDLNAYYGIKNREIDPIEATLTCSNISAPLHPNTTYLNIPVACDVDTNIFSVINQSSTRSYWERGKGTIIVPTIAFAASSVIVCRTCGANVDLKGVATPVYYTGYNDKPQNPPTVSDCSWDTPKPTGMTLTLRKINFDKEGFGPANFEGWAWNQRSLEADADFLDATDDKMTKLRISLVSVWFVILLTILPWEMLQKDKNGRTETKSSLCKDMLDNPPWLTIELPFSLLTNIIQVGDGVWRLKKPLKRNPLQGVGVFCRNLCCYSAAAVVCLGALVFCGMVLMFNGPTNLWFYPGSLLASWMLFGLFVVLGVGGMFVVPPVLVYFNDETSQITHFSHEYSFIPTPLKEQSTREPLHYNSIESVTYFKTTDGRFAAPSLWHPKYSDVYHICCKANTGDVVFVYEFTTLEGVPPGEAASAVFQGFKSFLEQRLDRDVPEIAFDTVEGGQGAVLGYDVVYTTTCGDTKYPRG